MKAFGLTALALLACLACANAQSPQLEGIAHVAYRVGDLEKARDFYRRLGFEESFAFGSGGKATQVFVKINDRQFIELYPRSDAAQPLGWLHVCYETDAAEALYALYAARGLKPVAVVKGGAGNFFFSLDDPQRRQIEFTQYLPGSRHSLDRGQHLGVGRISQAMLAVRMTASDFPAAERFYRAGLGFEKRTGKKPPRMRLSPEVDQHIELVPAGAKAMPQLVFRVSDTRMVAARLKELGLGAGRQRNAVQVRDPDGNILVFQKQ
jgi:catechol 2,3-dioxygenase-like lactoylglutathione lyase family enzyme